MSDVDLYHTGPSTALAVPDADPYARAAARAAMGIFLTFTKLGNYVAGQDKKRIPTGTRMIANMPGLRYGWRGWFGGPPEDLTELVSENRPVQRRADLGDTDQTQWASNEDGTPKDPWQLTYILELADSDGQIYIFAPTSFGGRRAVENMCGEYAKGRRMRPGMLPVVSLGSGTFQSKKWGETANPVLEIVGWTDAENPSVSDVDERADDATPRPRMTAEEFDRQDRFGDQTEGQRAVNPIRGANAQTAGNGASDKHASADAPMKSPSNGSSATTQPARRAPREF